MLESGTARLRALLTVAVTAIVAVAWLCWWRTPAPAVAPATSLVSRPPVDATAPASSPPPVAEAERMPAAPTITAPLLVRGRCLAVENDEPLAVTLHVGEDDGTEGALGSDDLATAASGTDGRFEFGVAFAGAKDLRLLATAPGRAPVSCRREGSQAGEVWDVGDVRLTLAARVSGEVVDATGEHVAAAQVALRMLGPELPAMSFRSTHLATTDAAGRFAMTAAVAAGEWYVGVDGTGALLTPRKTQVPAGGEHFVRIEVERPDPRQAITGRVVDSAGAPIAGAGLAAYGEGARGRAVSAADGTFLLHRGPPHFDRGKPGVELTAQAPSFEQVPAAGATVGWGQRDVVLVMRPLSTVLVRAIDSRGARLAGFDLLYGQITASGTWLDYAMAKAKPVADGVLLTGLRSGPHVLLLRPREDGQAVAGPEPFAVGAAAPDAVTVRVPDRVDVQVEVIDAAAAPVPQCELDLIARLGDAPVDSGLPAPRLRGLRSAGLRGSRQVALAAGSTDDRGIATLAAPPGRFSLFARCRTHLPVTQQVVVVANQPRIRVVLEAATVLHGRLTPVELLPAFGIAESKPERRLAVVARGPAAGTAPA
ncbi:MAG: carboxypeptidase-like regulatory domain-containing protein, partial [Planctomycetota bacterium]